MASTEFIYGVIEITRRDDNVVVLRLVGDHDLSSSANLRGAISDYAATGDGVIVDLTGATFIDSATLRELFAGDRVMRQRGRRLVLYSSATSAVDGLLDISGARNELLCCDTLTEAHDFARQRE